MAARELPPGDWRLKVYGHAIGEQAKKRKPTLTARRQVIALQGDQCLYCQIPIGTRISRRTTEVTLRREWDHFVPFAYLARNPRLNWVIACHVCNNIKSARVFSDLDHARRTILPIRERKGYEPPELVLRRIAASRGPIDLV